MKVLILNLQVFFKYFWKKTYFLFFCFIFLFLIFFFGEVVELFLIFFWQIALNKIYLQKIV
jgi:hypothetical protein